MNEREAAEHLEGILSAANRYADAYVQIATKRDTEEQAKSKADSRLAYEELKWHAEELAEHAVR